MTITAPRALSRRWLVLLAVLILGLVATAVAAPSARAGEWAEVACTNPNGSSAPSDNWTGAASAAPSPAPGDGSSANPSCTSTSPMGAALSTESSDAAGAWEALQYTPPTTSTLVTGQFAFSLAIVGATAPTAGLYTNAVSNPNAFGFCSDQAPCSAADPGAVSGVATVPDNGAQSVYVAAGCGGASSDECSTGSTTGYWSYAGVSSAEMLLQNDAVPAGTGFTGTALGSSVSGTGQLIFTATDPGGPGVYNVTVAIDGSNVYSATPNANSGQCASVGTYPGTSAMEFDYSQPCPATTSVTASVPTTSFSNGTHELTATVTDAAGNTATVLDQEITIDNPVAAPATPPAPTPATPLKKIKDKAVFGWDYRHVVTALKSVRLGKKARLPTGARMSVACEPAKLCPKKLASKSVGVKKMPKLFASLKGKRFKPGAVFQLTISAPHRKAERFVWTMRSKKLPAGRVRFGTKALPKNPITSKKKKTTPKKKTKTSGHHARRR